MATNAVKARLEQIVDQAQTRLDLETAQNPGNRRAIQVVEAFLRRTGRVCYGGQAINAHLPAKDKFYDPETSLPDYDFFSPDGKADTEDLIAEFKRAGYTEISKRIGMHEGTTKLYVNYTAIADITHMPEDLYNRIAKNSVPIQGIYYADPLFLQMMMYLELSRPRGEVARWTKVYERLRLLQRAHPLKPCGHGSRLTTSPEAHATRQILLNFMVHERRAFMGADIQGIYKTSGTGRSAASRTSFLLHGNAPLVFLSPDADADAEILAHKISARRVGIPGLNNILPPMVALYKHENLVGLIVQEEACHSSIPLPLTKQRVLRVASLDTVLTFLIGLYYRDDPLLMTKEALLCLAQELIKFAERYRAKPTAMFPAFSIECSGYQTTFASLLRAKAARIEADRQRTSSGVRATMKKRSPNRRGTTRSLKD